MKLFTAIAERRSIRAYQSREVPDKVLRELLQAATLAPSAGNLQPWFFVVVRNKGIRKQLSRLVGEEFLAQAPVVIAICAEPGRSEFIYGPRGVNLYCLQDTAAALENLLLAATAQGLGTCWVGAIPEVEVAHQLDLPPQLRPTALVTLGFPAESPGPRPRRPLQEVTRFID